MTAALVPSELEPEVSPDESIRKRLTVAEIVSTFEDAERDIRAGFALIEGARQRIREALQMDSFEPHVCDRWQRVDFGEPDASMSEVRRSVWRALVDHLELQRVMSIRAWDEFQKQIRDADPPPIDAETVGGMLRQLHSQIPAMLEEAVREVFEWLRPWRGDVYKTNKKYEIGPKVVLERIVESTFGRIHVHYHCREKLIALERVIQALDGRGMVHKHHQSELQTAIEAAPWGELVETSYFRARAFRKGTLHLAFKRLDLLKKLNQIAGGKRLRGVDEK